MAQQDFAPGRSGESSAASFSGMAGRDQPRETQSGQRGIERKAIRPPFEDIDRAGWKLRRGAKGALGIHDPDDVRTGKDGFILLTHGRLVA